MRMWRGKLRLLRFRIVLRLGIRIVIIVRRLVCSVGCLNCDCVYFLLYFYIVEVFCESDGDDEGF